MSNVFFLASFIKPGVGVIIFIHCCGILPVVKGEYSIANIAPFIGICVVYFDKLLRRECNKVASCNSVGTFKSTNCGKGPSGVTATLILGRGNSVVLSSIDGSVALNGLFAY
jgi:hypothetical protein